MFIMEGKIYACLPNLKKRLSFLSVCLRSQLVKKDWYYLLIFEPPSIVLGCVSTLINEM